MRKVSDRPSPHGDEALCAHELFERQVDARPDAIALSEQDQALTYHCVNARANRLARHLQELGIHRECLIGICFRRSIDSVIASIACLKIGAAFVPFDPDYPGSRLAIMTEDADLSLLLTHSQLESRLQGIGRQCLFLDELWPRILPLSEENLQIAVDPQNLAYIIYTSGSTGRPKGVAISHRSLVNLAQWHITTYAIGGGDQATHLASPGFDASVWELWPYLCAGAELTIVPDEVRAAPDVLIQFLQKRQTTICFLPTPLAEVLIEAYPVELSELKAVLTGGDRLRKRPRASWRGLLVNHYGPTENTVVSTAGDVASESERSDLPAIGLPISGVDAYALGEQFQPVAIGEIGELHLAGQALAQGYANDSVKTATLFVPNPFDKQGGGRMYRTGDLVRISHTGCLEFIGRKDRQVKRRGFRIEIGEIETALFSHPSVQTAVVESAATTRVEDHSNSDDGLIAYVVPRAPSQIDDAALLAFLRDRLPAFMIPTQILILPELPITPHGKIDRDALSGLHSTVEKSGNGFISPRNPIEEKLAAIWADSLGVEKVGIHDNFFEIGGDSLRSIQVISKANQSGLRLSARQLFQYQSIARLAEALGQAEP